MKKQAKKCNVYPRVWAAIWGCEGKGAEQFRGHNGINAATEYACPVCAEEKRKAAKRTRTEEQEYLAQAQEAAGVENYRYQKTAIENGRPVIVR